MHAKSNGALGCISILLSTSFKELEIHKYNVEEKKGREAKDFFLLNVYAIFYILFQWGNVNH